MKYNKITMLILLALIMSLFVGCGGNKEIDSVKETSFKFYPKAKVKTLLKALTKDGTWEKKVSELGVTRVIFKGSFSNFFKVKAEEHIDRNMSTYVAMTYKTPEELRPKLVKDAQMADKTFVLIWEMDTKGENPEFKGYDVMPRVDGQHVLALETIIQIFTYNE